MAARRVDMLGKHVMITGATAGIGEAAAFSLAEMGADVTIVCRNASKGEAMLARLRRHHPAAEASMLVADLGVQDDIRRVAEAFLDTGKPLHVLFNNAGVVQLGRSTTVDGLETTFAVNHMGTFLLTNLLLERLRASSPARVVCTASDAHRFFAGRGLDFDDLQSEKNYTTFGAYGRSKLCNILFTSELGRREQEVGSGVATYCFHPGFVGSDFAKNNGPFARALMGLLSPFARSSAKGAETGIYLCTSPEVADQSGRYYFNKKLYPPASAARTIGASEKLWEASKSLDRIGSLESP
jgi:NAD(P)-dependent dehydrogenase (short-subunit alcohol dehydrogenase family)